MIIQKYGGTSMGSAASIRSVANIISDYSTQNQLVIVVSAMSGVTDQLLKAVETSLRDLPQALEIIEAIAQRHYHCQTELGIESKATNELWAALRRTLEGVNLLGELSDSTRARVAGMGELATAPMLAAYLQSLNLDALWADSREYIKATSPSLNAKVQFDNTNYNIANTLPKRNILVVPGFIASTYDGKSVVLGRGGSDYTAAIFGAALNAEKVELWSDVNGMFTSDPRKVEKAHNISQMSYEEAVELSHFGAKVLYAPTIHPLVPKNIPLWLKNTFSPKAAGTLITNAPEQNKAAVKGLSCIQGMSLLTVSGSGMVGIPGFAMRMFRGLANGQINVYFITQSSSEHTISVAIQQSDASKAIQELKKEFSSELELHTIDKPLVEEELSILALVGDGMRSTPGVSGKAFSALASNGVNVRAIAQGATERNISVVVNSRDANKALNVLHDAFFLAPGKRAHLFVGGVGNVGRTFLRQVAEQQKTLLEQKGIDLRVVGISNSRKFLIEEKGINLAEWESTIEQSGTTVQDGLFAQRATELNLPNSIFVDNTASDDLGRHYASLLKAGVSVVTSNKVVASSPLPNYLAIKDLTKYSNVQFLYETNVAAGLPIINTLQELRASGDKVLEIEAVLSGSLNFIFNTLSPEVPFSECVAQARALGYTEPDPILDLSGMDVGRKILILARECGLMLDSQDIHSIPLLPADELLGLPWEELYTKLKAFDKPLEERRMEAAAKGLRLKFMARLKDEKATVGLFEIDSTHPAFHLTGSDNIVQILTQRYSPNPLVIKGAGAGPEVTAAGVFGDVLRAI